MTNLTKQIKPKHLLLNVKRTTLSSCWNEFKWKNIMVTQQPGSVRSFSECLGFWSCHGTRVCSSNKFFQVGENFTDLLVLAQHRTNVYHTNPKFLSFHESGRKFKPVMTPKYLQSGREKKFLVFLCRKIRSFRR